MDLQRGDGPGHPCRFDAHWLMGVLGEDSIDNLAEFHDADALPYIILMMELQVCIIKPALPQAI